SSALFAEGATNRIADTAVAYCGLDAQESNVELSRRTVHRMPTGGREIIRCTATITAPMSDLIECSPGGESGMALKRPASQIQQCLQLGVKRKRFARREPTGFDRYCRKSR